MRAASLDAGDDLEAIVARIAHDFGNVLAAVTNYVSLAARRVDDPTAVELLAGASKGARRAARLTRQLHDLGDIGSLAIEPVQVNDVVRAASDLLGEGLGEGCELRLELGDGPGDALASPRGVEMALGHLIQSACEAMPGGGVVTIATGPAGDGARSGVEVRVAHVGAGGPPAGLGLTIAGRAVERLGGELHIDSSPGGGTSVRLRFQGVASDG